MVERSIKIALSSFVLALVVGSVAGGFDANTDPSLVGWWRLDDGEGTVAVDSSPGGHDGTLINGPVWTKGYYGGGLQFDGTDDYVDTEWTDDLEHWTISIWVTSPAAPSNSNSYNGPLHREGNYQINWDHETSGWAGSVATYVGGWNSASLGPLQANRWYFLAGTFDGAELKAYTNGELITTLSLPGTCGPESNSLKLGRHAANAQYFGGTVDDARVYDRALTLEEIDEVMTGGIDLTTATLPHPDDGATDVPREVSVSWTPGAYAATHDVYFGTSWEDVNAASVTDPRGVLAAQRQLDATYTPPVRLAFETTYYWRTDEVNAAPDDTVFAGDVWSFTTEPEFYPVADVVASASAPNDVDQGPENTADSSGLNDAGEHSTADTTMWVGNPVEGESIVLQYDFDRVYKLANAQIWNFNHIYEFVLNFGLKDITIEYAAEPNEWVVLGDFQLSQATGTPTYTGQSIDLAGVTAQSVRIIATSNYGNEKHGLSEVQFYYIPAHAREPEPASGATGVAPDPVLSWRAGREAASHQIYLSTDEEAVAGDAALTNVTELASYAPSTLDLATIYYWRIDEVNEAETIAVWEGDIWSFTTRMYLVVDDFESYTDEEDHRVYQTWWDGYDIGSNGSIVGNDNVPYSEPDIVADGEWSMPFFYQNTNGAIMAEADRVFPDPQDWTQGGARTLAVGFYGTPGNTGKLYVKINGTKVFYIGDPADIDKAQWQQMLVDLSAVPTDLASVTSVAVGVDDAGAAGTLYFDSIRLYPDPVEFITPIQPTTDGLILRYTFDEGSGTVLRDTSGSGNNGTINGNPQWVDGAYSSALDFDGLSDYVSADASLLNDLEAFTIAYWLNADLSVAADRSGLVGQNDCIEHGVTPANTIQIWTPNGGSLSFDWPYAEPTEWHHVVATGDGTSLTIYLDGRAVATGGSALDEDDEGYGTSTAALNIAGGGVMDTTGNYLAAQIDEVYIYQRALSPAEVAGLTGRTEPIYEPF